MSTFFVTCHFRYRQRDRSILCVALFFISLDVKLKYQRGPSGETNNLHKALFLFWYQLQQKRLIRLNRMMMRV
jgi:hypothetical protein